MDAQHNEIGHEKIVALLRGESATTYIAGSDVKLNLLPLVSQVLVWADGKLPGGLSSRFSPPVIEPGTDPDAAIQEVANWSGKPLSSDFRQITLIQSDALGPAQAAVLVWLLGRRDVRAGVVAAGKRATGQAAEIRIPDSPVTTWVVNHAVAVRWGLVVVGPIVVALVGSSWLGIILTVVIVLLLWGFLSLVAAQWPFAEPGGDEAAPV